jgi:UDP-N-acetylmuramoyl-tripeptide--D-alanyl-D-alanine ligase
MIFKNLIYILQSENYYFGRFLKFSYTHPKWWKLERRQKITWTIKARLIWFVSLILFLTVALLFVVFFKEKGIVAIPFLFLLLPLLISASFLLLRPFDFIAKQLKIKAAQKIIAGSKACVIGITGSYGKTSAKEILFSILKQKFSVIKTPENVNTDIGIANFILKNKVNFNSQSIFIVEMGAYHRGEIAKICRMVQPIYSILTGINESHLERFGNLENIIYGKFELPQNTKEISFLNFDDKNIKDNYSRFNLNKITGISKNEAINIIAKENFKGLEFKWQETEFETALLAEHNITLILLCTSLARHLSMSLEEISEGVKKIKPIAHRLELIYNSNTNIAVIDDSYNGNFNGFVSGINLLKRANGRKVVLTPGLVELGSRMEEIHKQIGELYAKNVDLVLLIRDKMTDYIVEGLKRNNFSNYKIYRSTKEAHSDLRNILKSGDTIIFQNDLTDNYF